MTIHPINPHSELEELFEPIKSWRIPQVYYRPTDFWVDVDVEAGWNPASGEVIRIDRWEFTKDEAEQLSKAILAAVKFLDGHFVYEGEVPNPTGAIGHTLAVGANRRLGEQCCSPETCPKAATTRDR
ncbi:MAG: hypothetical protein QOK10_1948, partial [Pseudonocardiales bacterium]|nr:hypothetical protein [Pseudonocardiales bacterium]